jgi:hypothetical protein
MATQLRQMGIAISRSNHYSAIVHNREHMPLATVFALLNSFRRWPEWAPQDRDDRSLARTFAGPAEGVGAISEWQGSGASGAGRMEITHSVVDSLQMSLR